MYSPVLRRSHSAISLDELDAQSHTERQHRNAANYHSPDWSSGSLSPTGEHEPTGDQDQGRGHDHGSDHGSDQDSSEPRGAGSAVPPASGPGDASETPIPWRKHPISRLTQIWGSHVSCEVDMQFARDHLALERTFLGYLRTSMVMSILGTTIAQLFSITHHDSGFGYTVIGMPLATTCYIFSISTILLGAIRSWRHQRALMSGKALTGGFEIHLIGVGALLLLIVFFSFLVTIDVVKVTSTEPA